MEESRLNPFVLINFKTYEQGTGKKALKLAKLAEKVAKETGADIAVSVESPSIHMISQAVDIPVFAQHIDSVNFGSNTGHILPETVKEMGAKGTLLNHSERRLDFMNIDKYIEKCKSLGLKSLVCVKDLKETKFALQFSPDYIAYEDPELIGSGIPISKAQPDKVKQFVELFTDTETIPLCGAGISTGNDVKAAIELGTKGVLLASGVVKSDDPERVLRDLIS